MPYALEELLVPQKIKTKQMWVNRFMLAMIIIFSLASGPILYFTYKAEIKQNEITPKTDKFYTMDNVVCVFLSFISGIYLLSAVYKITKQKKLWMHVISWGLFLLSSVEVTIFTAILNVNLPGEENGLYIGYLCFDVTSFISQLIQITIMWQLAFAKTERTTESEYPAVEVAEYDAHAELQARIWN